MSLRRPILVLTLCVLVLGSFGSLAFARTPAASLTDYPTDAGRFGPILFLVGPTTEDQDISGVPSLVLHGRVPDGRYIASGSPDAAAGLAHSGIPSRVLDADTSGKVYYFFDSQAEGAQALAEIVGTVVYSDTQQLLVALNAADEPALLQSVAAASVLIALLPSAPLVLSEQLPPETAQGMGAEAETVDPTVASLLPLLTESALAQYIGDLSGEHAVLVGGNSVTLATRYTFASTVANSESYLYDYYAFPGVRSELFQLDLWLL